MTMTLSTPDLSDQFPEQIDIVSPVLGQAFKHYGALKQFSGMIATVKCFEDNSKVAEQVKTFFQKLRHSGRGTRLDLLVCSLTTQFFVLKKINLLLRPHRLPLECLSCVSQRRFLAEKRSRPRRRSCAKAQTAAFCRCS